MSDESTLSDTTQPIEYTMPTMARHPNPIPARHAGTIPGVAPRDQTPEEILMQETAEELRNSYHGEPPLPIFNR